MPARTANALPVETLFDRVTSPAARARGGVYLSLSWNASAAVTVRERVRARLAAEGWLQVSETESSSVLYAADSAVELRQVRELRVETDDGSKRDLGEFCALELRSAALASSRSERLRRSILANLGAILATQGIGLGVDLRRWPHVARSVLNFGVELPIGTSASTDALRRFEGAVKSAIRRFEPRLSPDAIEVEVVEPESALARGLLQMRVAASLRPAYGGSGIRFRTVIDLRTGRTSTEEDAAHA